MWDWHGCPDAKEPAPDLIPATTNALCPAPHFRNPFPSTQDTPAPLLVRKSGAARGPKSHEIAPQGFRNTVGSGAGGVGRHHTGSWKLFMSSAPYTRARSYKLQDRRGNLVPPCALPSTFANGESLHMGAQLISSQDLGWEQCKCRCDVSHIHHTMGNGNAKRQMKLPCQR